MTDPILPPDANSDKPAVPPAAPPAPSYEAPAAPTYNAPPPAQPGYGQPAYGQQIPGTPAYERYNVLSIVSLVSAFFVSVVAIVTGHIALSQIKRTGEKGRGLAIAGLVIGYVSIFFTIIALVIVFVIVVSNSGQLRY